MVRVEGTVCHKRLELLKCVVPARRDDTQTNGSPAQNRSRALNEVCGQLVEIFNLQIRAARLFTLDW